MNGGDIRFQKIFGLYGLKRHKVEISRDVTDAGRTEKQPVTCESFVKSTNFNTFPRWLEVTFSSSKAMEQIVVGFIRFGR